MRKRTAVAVVMMCAVGLGVVGAGSATAAGTTLHVCDEVKGTLGQDYSDSKCQTTAPGTGSFHTSPITVNTPTEVTTSAGESTLMTDMAGFVFELRSTSTTGTGTETNRLTEGGEMFVEGTNITLTFSGVTVVQPAGKGCKIKGGSFTFTGLKSKSSMPTEAETQVKFEPTTGTVFGETTVEGCTGSLAAFNGAKKFEGTSTGTQSLEPCSLDFSGSNGLTFGATPVYLTTSEKSVMAGTTKPVCIETGS